jgi:methylmalonyl-CoA mutase cobalamin-binding domain/chain
MTDMLLEKLRQAIMDCEDTLTEEAALAALEAGIPPSQVIDVSIGAIEQVGQDFEDQKIFIPELMLAGMGLEKALKHAQIKLTESGQLPEKRGTLIIGSVAGDVHNIGKDLVITLWRANGYQVHDLGVDVPRARFVSAAQELSADVVGLSALMSTTQNEIPEIMEMFRVKGVRDQFKIVIGGGVVTQSYADQIGADGYAEDAAQSVALIKHVMKK